MKKLYVIPSVEAYVIDQTDILTVNSGDGTPALIANGEFAIRGTDLFN